MFDWNCATQTGHRETLSVPTVLDNSGHGVVAYYTQIADRKIFTVAIEERTIVLLPESSRNHVRQAASIGSHTSIKHNPKPLHVGFTSSRSSEF